MATPKRSTHMESNTKWNKLAVREEGRREGGEGGNDWRTRCANRVKDRWRHNENVTWHVSVTGEKEKKKKEKKRKLNWIGNETTKRWWTGQDVHVCWGGVNAYRVELIKSRNNLLGILCVRWWAVRRRRIVFGRMLIVMTSLYPNPQSPPHRYLRWESWGID